MALNPPGTDRGAKAVGWNHIRASVVVPIGVIVAVAIVCVIVAVLSSARRANEVALDHERQLFIRSLTNYSEQILRETASVAASEAAVRRIRVAFDAEWVEIYVGLRLQSFFDHDFVFVTDASDRFLYASLGLSSADPNWFNAIRVDVQPVLDELRGRAPGASASGTQTELASALATRRASRIQSLLGRPAVVAAVAVASSSASSDAGSNAPVVLSVKFIDDDVLAEIASRLQLRNLRKVGEQPVPAGDYVFDLNEPNGTSIAKFAWSPKQPGAEILQSVLPFIAVALGGFALLAGLVLHHMRRTAATIASGESRLRYLAMHDPLCGLPNRIFFGERLEEMIEKVRKGAPTAAVLYIDLDHFKDVNDTLGHPVGDELIRNVTRRITHTLRSDDLVARARRRRVRRDYRRATRSCVAAGPRHAHDRDALRTLLHRQPYHRDRRQHRDCGHPRACGRRRRRHAACRHGALPRQERRPQPRLHLRRSDGRQPAPAQAARERPARGDRKQRVAGRLPADRQQQRRDDSGR